MKRIYFKCSSCNNYVENKTRVAPKGFHGVAYSCCKWYDIIDDSGSYKHLSVDMPKIGEQRIVRVEMPFDEYEKNQFDILFVPALSQLNGWDEYPDDICKFTIVRCEINKILDIDEYGAFLSVNIKDVTPVSELYRKYPEALTEQSLEEYEGISVCTDKIEMNGSRFEYCCWTGQGDIGEQKLIFTDDKGIRHLVITELWSFHESFVFFGNIIQKTKQIFI